jgi:hypothetical protein
LEKDELPTLGGIKMESRLLATMGKVAGLGGMALGVFLLLFQGVLKTQFLPQTGLSSAQAFAVIIALMIFTFGIAGIGVLAWLISHSINPRKQMPPWFVGVLAFLIAAVAVIAGVAAVQLGVAPAPAAVTVSPIRDDLPPYVEVSLEYPDPKHNPLKALYVWRNNRGPIYHREAHILDQIEAATGHCGELDSFNTRIIPLLNPNHHADPMTFPMAEPPFFVSDVGDYAEIFDHAVYAIESDQSGDILEPTEKAFQKLLHETPGLCGHLSRHGVLVRFDFVDVQGRTMSLFYRFLGGLSHTKP